LSMNPDKMTPKGLSFIQLYNIMQKYLMDAGEHEDQVGYSNLKYQLCSQIIHYEWHRDMGWLNISDDDFLQHIFDSITEWQTSDITGAL